MTKRGTASFGRTSLACSKSPAPLFLSPASGDAVFVFSIGGTAGPSAPVTRPVEPAYMASPGRSPANSAIRMSRSTRLPRPRRDRYERQDPCESGGERIPGPREPRYPPSTVRLRARRYRPPIEYALENNYTQGEIINVNSEM